MQDFHSTPEDGLERLERILASELSPYLRLQDVATLLDRRPEGFHEQVGRILDEIVTDDFDHSPPPFQVMVAMARGVIAQDAAKSHQFFLHAYALAMGIRDNPVYGTLYVEAAVALAYNIGAMKPPSGLPSAAHSYLNEAAVYIEDNVTRLGKAVPTLRLSIQDARDHLKMAQLLESEPGPQEDGSE